MLMIYRSTTVLQNFLLHSKLKLSFVSSISLGKTYHLLGENLPLRQEEWGLWPYTALPPQFKSSLSINLGSAQLMMSTAGSSMGDLKGNQSASRQREGTASSRDGL